VTYLLRVTKGPCKGTETAVSALVIVPSSAAKRGRKQEKEEALEIVVGRGEDCDLCLEQDGFLSERFVCVFGFSHL
jgi:hypothetical protein